MEVDLEREKARVGSEDGGNNAEGTPAPAFRPPYAIVQEIPISRPPYRLPLLFVQKNERETMICRDAAHWALEAAAGSRLSSIETTLKALARFIGFYKVFRALVARSRIDIDYILYAYIHYRTCGTKDNAGGCALGGLHWRPVSRQVARAEFKALAAYFAYCAVRHQRLNLVLASYRLVEDETPIVRLRKFEKAKERDFFLHLRAARNRWAKLSPTFALSTPALGRPPVKPKAVRHFPSTEEVWEIIRTERNPMYRCLWTAAAFGGLRVSEQLNAWQADILPSTSREFFFGTAWSSDNTILFLRTHPIESDYIGDAGRPGPTRQQHLIGRYGLLPRPLLSRSDPRYAGWKGTLCSGRFLTHPVFWADPIAAEIFALGAAEIRQFHRHHSTSKQHPYFYVNIADPTHEYRGLPLRIRRVQAALKDAFRRCGLEPHRWGRNVHGLRHHYKAYLETELGLAPEHIQIAMGHSSIHSQRDYGVQAMETHKALSAARAALAVNAGAEP